VTDNFLPLMIDEKKVYAGFWRRFGAGVVDFLILMPFVFLIVYLEGFNIPLAIFIVIFSTFIFSVYNVYFHYKFGATLGKMAVGIRVTQPDGSKIELKHALLRSSVDFAFALFAMFAQIYAILSVDSGQYLAAGMVERFELITPYYPVWYGFITIATQVWVWSEFLVLLFNKRRRAIHDFIAGTVVIKKAYAENEKVEETLQSATAS